MAGTNPGFVASEFRANIRDVMTMSQPVDVALRVTFCWNTAHTFSKPDPAGVPYDLTAAATTSTPHDPVQVSAAVEFAGESEESTAFGRVDTAKATLTLVDEDYETIKTSDYVKIGGNIYDFESRMPRGLFDFTVWTMHVRARSRA